MALIEKPSAGWSPAKGEGNDCTCNCKAHSPKTAIVVLAGWYNGLAREGNRHA